MRKVILSARTPALASLEQFFALQNSDFEILVLADLRAKGFKHTLRYLAQHSKASVYLLEGDFEQHGTEQAILLAALLTKSSDVLCIKTDLSVRSVPRRELLINFARVIWASAKNLMFSSGAYMLLMWLSICPKKADVKTQQGDILYLFPGIWSGFKAGGAIAHITGIMNAFIRSGKNVLFPSAWLPSGLNLAVDHQHINPISDWGFPAEANLYRLQFKLFLCVKRKIKKRKINFIYSRLTLGSFADVLLSRALKVPLVVEFNGSEAWIAQNWGRGLRLQRLAELSEKVTLRHADLIVTVSQPLFAELNERGIDRAKIIYQPNGVDISLFNPNRYAKSEIEAYRSDLGIPNDALVFGFIGTFGRWHGTNVLAASISEILQSHGSWVDEQKVRFLIAGDGDMLPSFVQQISPLDTKHLIHMPGFFPQEKGPLMMACCDVLIAPHIANSDGTPFFGSPIKIFEYLASGRPIIASDLDQIGDVLSEEMLITESMDSRNEAETQTQLMTPAMLIRPGSTIDLSKAILSAGNDSKWRKSAGLVARELAVKKYSWDQNVKQISEFLGPKSL